MRRAEHTRRHENRPGKQTPDLFRILRRSRSNGLRGILQYGWGVSFDKETIDDLPVIIMDILSFKHMCWLRHDLHTSLRCVSLCWSVRTGRKCSGVCTTHCTMPESPH